MFSSTQYGTTRAHSHGSRLQAGRMLNSFAWQNATMKFQMASALHWAGPADIPSQPQHDEGAGLSSVPVPELCHPRQHPALGQDACTCLSS